MTYEKFIHEYLGKGLVKKQETNFRPIQKLMTRAHRDLKTAKANLSIDEDKMRKKRNVFTYDVTISISKVEANNALNTAVRFVYLTDDIIKKQNPQTEFKF